MTLTISSSTWTSWETYFIAVHGRCNLPSFEELGLPCDFWMAMELVAVNVLVCQANPNEDKKNEILLFFTIKEWGWSVKLFWSLTVFLYVAWIFAALLSDSTYRNEEGGIMQKFLFNIYVICVFSFFKTWGSSLLFVRMPCLWKAHWLGPGLGQLD